MNTCCAGDSDFLIIGTVIDHALSTDSDNFWLTNRLPSFAKEMNPLSNNRSMCGANISPLAPDNRSSLSESFHGFTWLAISRSGSVTPVTLQALSCRRTLERKRPCPTRALTSCCLTVSATVRSCNSSWMSSVVVSNAVLEEATA